MAKLVSQRHQVLSDSLDHQVRETQKRRATHSGQLTIGTLLVLVLIVGALYVVVRAFGISAAHL